jgi:hypothetical protein
MIRDFSRISKLELVADVRQAIENKRGFALGKIGFSEQFLLGYLPFLKTNPSLIQIKAYEAALRYHCEIQFGVFPTDPDFLKEFARLHTACTQAIDILGLFDAKQEKDLIVNNEIQSKLIFYQQTEPDRSIPEMIEECYLPFLKNKKILFISSFAELLKDRAKKEIFEGVWSEMNKKWFYPENISAIEVPYSYITAAPNKDYTSSIHLYETICEKIDQQDYDIALIGMGSLGLPLAAHVKSKQKVALSLGGHLQVLFGVLGKRWKDDKYWITNYINDSWIEMPVKYHPKDKDILADSGAYW